MICFYGFLVFFPVIFFFWGGGFQVVFGVFLGFSGVILMLLFWFVWCFFDGLRIQVLCVFLLFLWVIFDVKGLRK